MADTIVFKIGGRYLYSLQNGRVSTACYLAGAMLVGTWQTERIQLIEEALQNRKKKYVKVFIGEVPGDEGSHV